MCAGMNVIDVPGTLVRTRAVWGATHDWLAAPPPRRHRPSRPASSPVWRHDGDRLPRVWADHTANARGKALSMVSSLNRRAVLRLAEGPRLLGDIPLAWAVAAEGRRHVGRIDGPVGNGNAGGHVSGPVSRDHLGAGGNTAGRGRGNGRPYVGRDAGRLTCPNADNPYRPHTHFPEPWAMERNQPYEPRRRRCGLCGEAGATQGEEAAPRSAAWRGCRLFTRTPREESPASCPARCRVKSRWRRTGSLKAAEATSSAGLNGFHCPSGGRPPTQAVLCHLPRCLLTPAAGFSTASRRCRLTCASIGECGMW